MRRRLRVNAVNLVCPKSGNSKNFFSARRPRRIEGLHRADAAFQNFEDVLVTQAIRDRARSPRCERHRESCCKALDDDSNFGDARLLEGRARDPRSRYGLALPPVRIDGNIFLHVAFEPALVIQRFGMRLR